MKETINKSEWLLAGQCLTQAWLSLRSASSVPSEADIFRMEQGQEIGTLARRLFPSGVLVSKTTNSAANEATHDLISRGVETIFEATFVAGYFVAKADILRREEGGWKVLEVKSTFSDKADLRGLVDDLAYTVMVLQRSGLPIAKASLVLLSRDYRFGQDPERLFMTIDQTAEVFGRVAEIECGADSIAQALLSDTQPEPTLVSVCRDCDYFETRCLGAQFQNTVLELPGLHHKKLKRLSDEGIVNFAHLPDDLELNERQERAKASILSGATIVEPSLSLALDTVAWPCFYLDFETVATTLPLYEGHGCHQQVLTQFSIHRRDSLDGEIQHFEYLADSAKDCQRELATKLIESLEDRGSVIVYSSFEKTRIASLRDAFPDLAQQLQRILSRLVDLLLLVADYVYHSDFKGSFSIKQVLPALVPDLSYAGLDVRDGGTAIARFARMALGDIAGEAVDATRKQLLAYCELDTLAMVRLHEALRRLATKTRHAGNI